MTTSPRDECAGGWIGTGASISLRARLHGDAIGRDDAPEGGGDGSDGSLRISSILRICDPVSFPRRRRQPLAPRKRWSSGPIRSSPAPVVWFTVAARPTGSGRSVSAGGGDV